MSSYHPERLDLSTRAKPPKDFVNIKKIDISKSNNFMTTFSLLFENGTTLPLEISLFDPSNGSWLLHFGGESAHDVKPKLEMVKIQKDDTDECVELTNHESTLSIGTQKPYISLSEKDKTLTFTPVDDFNVAGQQMSFPIFLHKDGVGISLGISHKECLYGGGEDFASVKKNGRFVDLYNTDALGTNGQNSYQSTPFFYSTRGYSLALLHAMPTKIDFGSIRHEVMSIMAGSRSMSLLLTPSKSPEDAASMFRNMLAPTLSVPDWTLKLWLSRCFYKDQSEVMEVIDKAKVNNISAGVINLDARSWMRAETRTDFVWDEERFEPFDSFSLRLHRKGYEISLWENPFVSSKTEELFDEGEREGYFATNEQGLTYKHVWVPEGLPGFPKPPPAGIVDFTNKKAWAWWKDLHRPFLKAGIKCFKTDFGEEIPDDAHFHDGSSGDLIRNRYSDLYNQCVQEVLVEELKGEGVLWPRSGNFLSHAHPIKWGGDSQSSWRSLRATVRAGLNQSFGGSVFWSHDIGGFSGHKTSNELYTRWAQFGMWCSHIRCHGTTEREPWAFGEEVLETFRQSLEVREHLMPYFKEMVQESTKRSTSFIRHLLFSFPLDPAVNEIDDQFMCGDHVLVAPIVDCTGGRSIYIPEGEWMDLRTQKILKGKCFIGVPREKHIPVYARTKTKYQELFEGVKSILEDK
jgi:alpha-D-xyloside xylohydrolase